MYLRFVFWVRPSHAHSSSSSGIKHNETQPKEWAGCPNIDFLHWLKYAFPATRKYKKGVRWLWRADVETGHLNTRVLQKFPGKIEWKNKLILVKKISKFIHSLSIIHIFHEFWRPYMSMNFKVFCTKISIYSNSIFYELFEISLILKSKSRFLV